MLGWLLVIVLVVVIFSAHKLPALKEDLKGLSEKGLNMAKKGKEKAEAKIAEAKKKKEEKAAKEEKADKED